jgi:hypothetical protein
VPAFPSAAARSGLDTRTAHAFLPAPADDAARLSSNTFRLW